MSGLKVFMKLTLYLECITYAVLTPMGFAGAFIGGRFIVDSHRFIYGTLSLVLAIAFNILVGLVFRKVFILDALKRLYEKPDLSYEERKEIKLKLLKYPLKEGIVMVVRWIFGIPSIMLVANIFMPMAGAEYRCAFLIGICFAFLGFISSYLNSEKCLTDIFLQTKLYEIEIADENYTHYGITSKLIGVIVALLICICFSFCYLGYSIQTGYLQTTRPLLYNLGASGILMYTSITFVLLFVSSIKKSLGQIEKVVYRISNKDLTGVTVRITSDEIGNINRDINTMIKRLKQMILEVKQGATNINEHAVNLSFNTTENATTTEQVAITVHQIAEGATDLARNTQDSNEKLEILASEIDQLVAGANAMQHAVETSVAAKQEGLSSMQLLNDRVKENIVATDQINNQVMHLENKSEAIDGINGTIKFIANQINMLSLNAAIEAARAGEHGHGFAVVAEEIRKLAGNVQSSAKNIEDIISEIREGIKNIHLQMQDTQVVISNTSEAAEKTGDAFRLIETEITDMIARIQQLTDSLLTISTNKNTVVDAMQAITAIAQESAASTEEISASLQQQAGNMANISGAANSLNQVAASLEQLIQAFKLEREA